MTVTDGLPARHAGRGGGVVSIVPARTAERLKEWFDNR